MLGRLIETRLPERDRLTVEPSHDHDSTPNPLGVVQLLTAIDLETGHPLRGVPISPRIGQHVFSAHPLVVKQVVESGATPDAKRIQLATFPHATDTAVSLSPSQLLGRHCAILGATGGGKSWTLARLTEEIARLGGKAILFDATGEFRTQTSVAVTHAYLGGRKEGPHDVRRFLSFPYWDLTESDLFVLLRPSPGVQAPKLKEALRSLKIAHLAPALANGGLIRKAGNPRQPFEAACIQQAVALTRPGTFFDIAQLSRQIWEECVYPSGFNAQAANWGGATPNEQSACVTLMSRIESELASPNLECLFSPDGLDPLPGVVEEFLADADQRILRISLEFLSFEHNAREVAANAVGRYLLSLARQGRFLDMPVVVLLDEAHQFLDKSVGDEFTKADLDAFGLIAKEGRKYSLTCVLATQRPRDIPEDVLSQMGMFIVHRLINERDRIVVEKACGDLDASAASFLPTLGQGEAMVVGVSAPMPLPVTVHKPARPPSSRSADFEGLWG
ncbi:ATP-binding protein [Nitrogeniibacter mangrovi]|uniref:ATP-binding protein n=1 Tax=Nitrogeniibacter mangrovi TaxID=2016596 RepID=UPI001C2D9918|nr:ATP-binding protein [Nitrogeniibacter mangrovi]